MLKLVSCAVLTVVILCILLAGVSNGRVIGIDYGSEFLKVAGPHNDKGVDIVLNELSRRKTDNFIGFRNGDLYLGDTAKTLAARFPLCTANALNQLIGLEKNSLSMNDFNSLNYEYSVDFDEKGAALVPICKIDEKFTAKELYSMMLSYFAAAAAKDGVIDPKSAVITIPFSTTPRERRAILEASRLAGLSVLGLMHSTTAAALYYGMRHRGFGENTVNLIVFDLGSTHTEVGVYRFSPRKPGSSLKVAFGTLSAISVIEDRTLGGRSFDLCVASVMEKEAVEKLNIDPVLNGKTPAQLKSRFSLLRAANKVREILSVNSNTPYTVEGIAPDRDFHSTMTRSTFESECAHLFERVKDLTKTISTSANISLADIKSFEMMGGLSRTPKIIADISDIIGRDVDRTMNTDEAAAIGAAYYAAKLSPFYRARSFQFDENIPYDVFFSVHPTLDEGRNGARRPLFVTGAHRMGESLSLTFNRTDDFSIDLFADENSETRFSTVDISGVKDALTRLKYFNPTIEHANNSAKVRLQVVFNESGLIHIESAEVIVRYAAEVLKKVPGNVTDEETGEEKTVVQSVPSIVMKTQATDLYVAISWDNPPPPSESELNASEVKLHTIWESERIKHARATAKNNLEGYIFWAKNDGVMENTTFVEHAKPEALAEIGAELKIVLEWLEDGDGSSDRCAAEEYIERLNHLKQLVSLGIEPKQETPVEVSEVSEATEAPTPPEATEKLATEKPAGSTDDDLVSDL